MNLFGLLAGALELVNRLGDWLRQAYQRRIGRVLQRGEQAEQALKQLREADAIEARNRGLGPAARRKRLRKWFRDADDKLPAVVEADHAQCKRPPDGADRARDPEP